MELPKVQDSTLLGGFTLNSNATSCTIPYVLSTFLAVFFVGSIYVWKQSSERSNHHSVIKKRFLSITIVSILAVAYVHYFVNASLVKDHTFWEVLGFRWSGMINAIVLPILLTVVLFLGPLVIDAFDGRLMWPPTPTLWLYEIRDILWIRNYVFAPVAEELVFRPCMLALLIHCTEPIKAVFVCPLFFGAAHLHHVLEQVKFGTSWKKAILISSAQFLYTTIFGAYSAYLFLRTGHIVAPILVHSFCNALGFPNFTSVFKMPPYQLIISIFSTFLGFGCWIILLRPMTHPSLFDNRLPWSSYI